jgi:hypothetical protein
MKLVMGNSNKSKESRYERSFSTSRQNGSVYDMFTESIFNTSFIRAESDGSVGRRAGSQIEVNFSHFDGTIYETLDGDYLITAIHNHYSSEGENKVFRSIMDLYRPYCKKDSAKTKKFDKSSS